ncbi:hypothetical protein BURMUCGD2M_6053 [Burkholderia multivorans CGD2M]|uniref:Uncharacterized protein n=1 Tax=Burkholderia multivorans CGD2 TaxID=513052 RepID=B9BLV4_9BURK|nr:hypothetical protein BURMUCGD2_6062 [Burkholderia multivorans CGD2]EEE16608.1 hypothetical protein BURMUCGD2M_6053 [Burkholderia multivorans CGD2M]
MFAHYLRSPSSICFAVRSGALSSHALRLDRGARPGRERNRRFF